MIAPLELIEGSDMPPFAVPGSTVRQPQEAEGAPTAGRNGLQKTARSESSAGRSDAKTRRSFEPLTIEIDDSVILLRGCEAERDFCMRTLDAGRPTSASNDVIRTFCIWSKAPT